MSTRGGSAVGPKLRVTVQVCRNVLALGLPPLRCACRTQNAPFPLLGSVLLHGTSACRSSPRRRRRNLFPAACTNARPMDSVLGDGPRPTVHGPRGDGLATSLRASTTHRSSHPDQAPVDGTPIAAALPQLPDSTVQGLSRHTHANTQDMSFKDIGRRNRLWAPVGFSGTVVVRGFGSPDV